jgi:hypothetical protein
MALIKGTNVIAPIVPFDTADVHPSHEALYGRGGYRTVADTTERDAIPSARREAGMLVFVEADGEVWQLGGDLTSWSEFASGGGGGDYLPLAGGTMVGNIVFDSTGGQYIGKGSFDRGEGGSYGISLVCAVGYSLNWQSGWVRAIEQNSSDARPLYLDSAAGTTLRAWDEAEDEGVEVAHDGITFADATTQTSAWTGSFSYDDLDDVPSTFVPPVATASVLGGVKQGSNTTIAEDGTISVAAPYTLPIAGSASGSATLGGLVVGTGFTSFANGRLDVAYGVASTNACAGNDARLSNARTPTSHVHGNISNAGAIGSTSGQIVVTTTSGVLTTAASIALSQLSQSSATTGQVAAWNGSAWAPAAAGGYTLPNATTSTLGGLIVGTGLSVTSGTVSVSYGTSSSTACVGNDARLSDSRTPTAHDQAWSTITSTPTTLSGYGITDAVGSSDARLTDSRTPTAHNQAWSTITSTPTTLSGYGITDAVGSSDSRLTDSRTPTAHTHGLGDLTQGGATTGQVIAWSGSAWAPATVSGGGGSTSASDLTSGTLADARLSDKARAAASLYLWSNFR